MRNVCTAVAVVLLAITPLMAANNPTLISIPRAAVAQGQDTMPDFITSSVLTGMQDPGVLPTFDCVSGASVVTLCVALPLSVVHAGDAISFTVTGDDTVYSGPCTFSYAVSTDVNTPPVQSGNVSTTCYPSVWIAWFPTVAPGPGRYIVQGAIHTQAGAKKSVLTAPLTVLNP